jgi:D-glycerate 3-kinase
VTAEGFARVEVPLGAELACRVRAHGAPFVFGVAGAQGSGKSTLAARLVHVLAARFGVRAALLSLDDVYLTRAERAALAAGVHPLLATRGVPGTHDVALGLRAIDALLGARAGEVVRYPRFDKAHDDRAPDARWHAATGPFDAVILEGWCVAALPESAAALAEPCNALERAEDRDGRFRGYANAQLAGPYRALFERLHAWLYLEVPDLEASRRWRGEQEAALRAGTAGAARVMDAAALARFAQHFERISRHMLAEAPARADIVVRLGRDHAVQAVAVRAPCAGNTLRDAG